MKYHDEAHLQESEMPERLKQEFAAFFSFFTIKFYGAQQDVICAATAHKYMDHLR